MVPYVLRDRFPQLKETIYGKPLVYLDNAATAQRLDTVLDLQDMLSRTVNANIHRGVHRLSELATDAFEKTRDVVKGFIGAASREEIIFTSGTTAAINLVASSYGEAFIGEGDEIVVSEVEHHSNIVPWQLLAGRKKAVIKVLPVDDSGHLRVDALEELLSPRTKIVAVSQVSNVLGLLNPVAEIVDICHKKGIPVLIDGAQGIVHEPVDVSAIDCDFYVFSGHKMYAATGTGVLYGKKKWLDAMPPYMGGGEMIASVSFSGTTYAPLPEKFEAGTQNFNAIPTLAPAIEALNTWRGDTVLQSACVAVRDFVLKELTSRPRVRLFGIPDNNDEKVPLFSFAVEGAHHEDLALILDKMGIAVRSGQMCAEPTMDRFGVTGMVRASFAPYNTMEEAEFFVRSLDKAIGMLV